MASWKEIEDIKRDPTRARGLAKSLLARDMDWNDWEEPFLEGMTARRESLTTRQAEKLLELRDNAKRVSAIRGFSVRSVLCSCWDVRLDLDDDDMEWLDKLKASSLETIRYRDAGRLMSCARRLGVIDA